MRMHWRSTLWWRRIQYRRRIRFEQVFVILVRLDFCRLSNRNTSGLARRRLNYGGHSTCSIFSNGSSFFIFRISRASSTVILCVCDSVSAEEPDVELWNPPVASSGLYFASTKTSTSTMYHFTGLYTQRRNHTEVRYSLFTACRPASSKALPKIRLPVMATWMMIFGAD